jgi:hypothetical protein
MKTHTWPWHYVSFVIRLPSHCIDWDLSRVWSVSTVSKKFKMNDLYITGQCHLVFCCVGSLTLRPDTFLLLLCVFWVLIRMFGVSDKSVCEASRLSCCVCLHVPCRSVVVVALRLFHCDMLSRNIRYSCCRLSIVRVWFLPAAGNWCGSSFRVSSVPRSRALHHSICR